MKQLIIAIIGVWIYSHGLSQSCLPEGITFNTQGQIDSFNINYPNCTEIEGNVTILTDDETNITNLNGLILVTSIGGSLEIKKEYYYANSHLTSLLGLEGLAEIGESLYIHGNSALTSLAGINNLTSVGDSLLIISNNELTSLTGLSNLTFVGSHVIIRGNYSLTDLSGLDGLTTINGNLGIGSNYNLVNLRGLDNVSYISGRANISDHTSLENLQGLDNLTSTGGSITILNNFSLTSLSGLDNLTEIGGFLTIKGTYHLTELTEIKNLTSIGGYLRIEMNHSLTNMIGLLGVNSIEGGLYIRNNDDIISLSGLDNINAGSITNLQIYYNDSLCNCAVQSICEYIAAPGGDYKIRKNASGCNSPLEVDSSCVYLSNSDAKELPSFSILPNPAVSQITIEFQNETHQTNTTLTIYNINGQQQIMHQITEPITSINVSGLKSGIYFVKIISNEYVLVTKIIKN